MYNSSQIIANTEKMITTMFQNLFVFLLILSLPPIDFIFKFNMLVLYKYNIKHLFNYTTIALSKSQNNNENYIESKVSIQKRNYSVKFN